MSTSGPCGRLKSVPGEAQIGGLAYVLPWLSPSSSSEKYKEGRTDAARQAGGVK